MGSWAVLRAYCRHPPALSPERVGSSLVARRLFVSVVALHSDEARPLPKHYGQSSAEAELPHGHCQSLLGWTPAQQGTIRSGSQRIRDAHPPVRGSRLRPRRAPSHRLLLQSERGQCRHLPRSGLPPMLHPQRSPHRHSILKTCFEQQRSRSHRPSLG